MKHFKNEKGLTLVELLATMTILLIIGGLFYGLLTQVFTNFDTSEKKITARQEANIIIAQLTTIHQKSNSYTISFDTPHSFITETESGAKMKLGHPNYTYTLEFWGEQYEYPNNAIEVDLKNPDNKSIPIELTLKSSNGNDNFTITTTLSRMTEAKTEEE